MKQAIDFDVGQSFVWQGESYVVVKHEEDNVIVHRAVDAAGNVIANHLRFDKNFNPYAYVKSVL